MMKTILIAVLACLLHFPSQAQSSSTKCPNDSWVKHPDRIKANYIKNGFKIVEQKVFVIGTGTPHNKKEVVKRLTLPIGAQQVHGHAFFASSGDGCLGERCWVEGLNHDHNWGSMHFNREGFNSNGNPFIEYNFRNWSNCDTRVGYCFVAYK